MSDHLQVLARVAADLIEADAHFRAHMTTPDAADLPAPVAAGIACVARSLRDLEVARVITPAPPAITATNEGAQDAHHVPG